MACFSCSDDEGQPKSAACDVAGRETDLCRVWVRRSIACATQTGSEETLLAQCRSDWGDYPNRVAPCFVAEVGECLATGCGSDDQCYSDAIVANDPSVVDIERYRACTASATATGCDDLVIGFLKACLDRAHECSVFDDLCASIVAMKQPYRADGEACIQRSCGELEGCLYAAMGRTKAK
jgi:hypothetical protein